MSVGMYNWCDVQLVECSDVHLYKPTKVMLELGLRTLGLAGCAEPSSGSASTSPY